MKWKKADQTYMRDVWSAFIRYSSSMNRFSCPSCTSESSSASEVGGVATGDVSSAGALRFLTGGFLAYKVSHLNGLCDFLL